MKKIVAILLLFCGLLGAADFSVDRATGKTAVKPLTLVFSWAVPGDRKLLDMTGPEFSGMVRGGDRKQYTVTGKIPGNGEVQIVTKSGGEDNSVKFSAKAKFPAPTKLKFFGFVTYLDAPKFTGEAIAINGKKVMLAMEKPGTVLFRGKASEVEFPETVGLKITGDFEILVMARTGSFELRFNSLEPEQSEYNLTLKIISSSFFLVQNENWHPLEWEKDVIPGSALDFSGRLDAPAGKYGFVTTRGEKLIFADAPEKPVVFWGTTLCTEAPFLADNWPERVAERLAAAGFNAVRMHHHDGIRGRLNQQIGNDTTQLHPERADQFDRLVAELKKRGIYITTDIFCTRRLAKGEIPEFPDKQFTSDGFKGLVLISDSALENWKRYARNWLTHVNPYTGLALKDDPVLISLSLVNEGSITRSWNRDPVVADLYLAKFAQWRKQRPDRDVAGKSEERVFAEFLMETYNRRYTQMSQFLKKELGVKVPLTDQNYSWQNILTVMRDRYDYVDMHAYHAHPRFPGGDWELPARFSTESDIQQAAETPRYLMRASLYGKPMMPTEYDFAAPNPYRAEGPLLVSSYMMAQGWSGVFQYAYAHRRSRMFEDMVPMNYFDSAADLLKLLALRIGSSIALDGGMKPATLRFAVPIPAQGANWGWRPTWPGNDAPAEVWKNYWNNHYSRQVDRLGLIGRFGNTVYSDKLNGKFDAVIDIGGNLPADVDGMPVLRKSADKDDIMKEAVGKKIIPATLCDPEHGIYNSSNGQIRLDTRECTFAVITPTCEAFSLAPGRSAKGKFLAIDNKVGHGVFAAIAMDRLPLKESGRILLLHLTDAQGSMTEYASVKRNQIEAWGRPPLLAARGTAAARILSGRKFRAWALNSSGRRLGEVKFTDIPDGLLMPLEVFSPAETVFAYELVRQPDSGSL